jgi:predicted AAA+ superfamily ATPase
LFLIRRLPGWRPGLGAREAARPKAYICDPGLLAHLLGADETRIRTDDQVNGEIAAVEVKAAATIDRRNRRWLERLRDARPDHFKAGIILHAGAQTTPLGDRLWAVPFSGLWT